MNKLSAAALCARLSTWVLPLAALVALSACNTDTHNKINTDTPMVEAGAKRAQAPTTQLDYNPLVVTDKVWTGSRAMRMRHGLPLPVNYEGQHSMTLVSVKSMALPDLASYISQQTGVPVRLVDGAEKVVGGPVGAAGMAAAASPMGDGGSATDSQGPDLGMKVAYQGPLSGFLDNVASYFGVSWRYDGAAIIVSRFETRTFTVEAMNGKIDYSDGISGGGGGGSSGSGGASAMTGSVDQTTKLGGSLDYWTELEGSINTILSGVGTVKASQAAGTVTVITTPEIMRTVAQYIGQENERATRQVAVTVEMFTVTLNDGTDIGANVNAVYQKLNGWGKFGLNGPPSPLDSASAGTGLGVSVVNPLSRWSGSSALIQALSTIGNVSRVIRIPLTTLNNRPASRRIGQDTTYLAQVSTTTTSGTDTASETLTPGTVQDGFSLQVTPRILGDSRILVQFSLQVTDLLEISKFTSNTSTIQLPKTASSIFVQQAMLNNGDTLVLAGYDQDRNEADNTGTFSPYFMLLGGENKSVHRRDLLFLTLTPREIDVPHRSMIDADDNGQPARAY